MTHESQSPEETGTPPGGPQTEDVPVLAISGTGAVSKRKTGKTGPAAKKARTAAKRKPLAKPPAPRKGATRKTAAKAASGKSFKSADEASGGWRTKAKVGGRKPSAAQTKRGAKTGSAKAKKAAARAAPLRPLARKAAKKATRR
jgi:hypothetical protein